MESIFPYLVYALIFLVVLALGLNFYAFLKISKTNRYLKDLFAGKKAANLEEIILELVKKNEKLDTDIEDLFGATNQINLLSLKGLARIGLTRFNAYGEKGHKDCFAVALLNSKKRGLVISSLNTQTGTRIFVKKVSNGQSDIQLTAEEQAALKSAQ